MDDDWYGWYVQIDDRSRVLEFVIALEVDRLLTPYNYLAIRLPHTFPKRGTVAPVHLVFLQLTATPQSSEPAPHNESYTL